MVNPKPDMLLEAWHLSFSDWNSHRWVRHLFSKNKSTAYLPYGQKAWDSTPGHCPVTEPVSHFRPTFRHNVSSLPVTRRELFNTHRPGDKQYVFFSETTACDTKRYLWDSKEIKKANEFPEMRPFLLTVMAAVHKGASWKQLRRPVQRYTKKSTMNATPTKVFLYSVKRVLGTLEY